MFDAQNDYGLTKDFVRHERPAWKFGVGPRAENPIYGGAA